MSRTHTMINKIPRKSLVNKKIPKNFKMIQKAINQDKISISFNKNKIIILTSTIAKTFKIKLIKINNLISRIRAIMIIMNLVRNS